VNSSNQLARQHQALLSIGPFMRSLYKNRSVTACDVPMYARACDTRQVQPASIVSAVHVRLCYSWLMDMLLVAQKHRFISSAEAGNVSN
jgi:hypothetical protein